jgi:hypothetical protein
MITVLDAVTRPLGAGSWVDARSVEAPAVATWLQCDHDGRARQLRATRLAVHELAAYLHTRSRSERPTSNCRMVEPSHSPNVLSPDVPNFGRRQLLLGGLAAAATLALPACADEREELDAGERFYLLSQLLTGFAELDEGLAELYRSSVEANADQAAALEQLYEAGGFYTDAPQTLDALEASGALDPAAELADQIILMWYSGIYVTANGDPQVATHLDALCWRALDTNAPSQCGGALGFWTAAPSN